MTDPTPAIATWQPGMIRLPESLSTADVAAIKDALSPAQTVALTAWAEARSRLVKGKGWVKNPPEALRDIMHVIDNRAKDPRWGDHKAVCFARRQFSCWAPLEGESNYATVLEQAQHLIARSAVNAQLEAALVDAHALLADSIYWEPPFPVGTCHYYSDTMPMPPKWALDKTPVAERHGHRFFTGIA